MLRKSGNKAFTFVEIIVVVTIIWILGTIGFNQFVWNISNWRDTLRKSNMANISWSMKTYKQTKWSYPIPADYFETKTWSLILAWQWKLNKNVSLSTIEEIPYDPEVKIPYLYSITTNKQEFEIAMTLENGEWEYPIAFTDWSYKSVAKNILPTILVATWVTIDISDTNNKKLFIFDNQKHNLPYDFDWNEEPISDWELSFDDLLLEAEQNWVFSQNSSFETCLDIRKAGKSIWDWEYQIRTNTWALSSTWCTF